MAFHPVHVSVLNIEHVKEKNELDLTFRIFSDDLRMLAFHRYGDWIDTLAIADTAKSDGFIERYVQSMVQLVINNNDTLKLGSYQKKVEAGNLWLYYSVPVGKEINHFHISNYLLMDIFGDQTNLVIVNINGIENGFSLDASNAEAELNFP
jgi:hypothetical protein